MSLKEKLSTSQDQSDETKSATDQLSANLTDEARQFGSTLQNTQEGQEACQRRELDNLLAITCLFESDNVQKEPDGTYSSQPHDAFYFCTKGGLTIGYGTKIEYRNGRLCREGEEILERLDLKRNNRSLTMDEKRALVNACFTRRKQRDDEIKKNGKVAVRKTSEGKDIPGTVKTCDLRPTAQKAILFNNNDFACIDKQNALDVARYEYKKKQENLLKNNPFLANSYFLKAYANDCAYQNGDAGVRNFEFYKNALNQQIASDFYPTKRPHDNETDRYKMRTLLYEMAHKTLEASKSRKGGRASPESQVKFMIESLKTFTTEFRSGIMKREKQKIVMMEKFMTITMMQCYRNVKGADLTLDEIKQAERDAHHLVYDQLFNSEIIQQLPNQIRPIVLVEGIAKIDTDKMDHTWSNINSAIQNSILNEAKSKLQRYNEKHNKNLGTLSPIDMCQIKDQNGRC